MRTNEKVAAQVAAEAVSENPEAYDTETRHAVAVVAEEAGVHRLYLDDIEEWHTLPDHECGITCDRLGDDVPCSCLTAHPDVPCLRCTPARTVWCCSGRRCSKSC